MSATVNARYSLQAPLCGRLRWRSSPSIVRGSHGRGWHHAKRGRSRGRCPRPPERDAPRGRPATSAGPSCARVASETLNVTDVIVLRLLAELARVHVSIMRARSGLMDVSLIGVSLGLGFRFWTP